MARPKRRRATIATQRKKKREQKRPSATIAKQERVEAQQAKISVGKAPSITKTIKIQKGQVRTDSFRIKETNVISTRGRFHPMEAAHLGQPQTDQDLRMSSTVISAWRYSKRLKALDVTFISGAQYRYFGIPEIVPHMWKQAGSKGRYFNEIIKGQYKFKRME